MTSEIFINWLHQIDKKMTKKKRSIVMIVDNCPAHPHVKGLKSMKLVFLPPNMFYQATNEKIAQFHQHCKSDQVSSLLRCLKVYFFYTFNLDKKQ
jgi:hypothetical protein